MLLTIDAGNTNCTFAIYDEGQMRGSWRISTDPRRTADEYAVWLSQLMSLQQLELSAISHVILASVVPQATFNLVTLCARHFQTDPMIIGRADVDLGIEIEIDRPEEAGADRVVNAVAARSRYGAPLIIVDFGTATTFDIVNERGNYAGGVIAPGLNLSMEALHRAAAQLPKVDVVKPSHVIGRSTIMAMRSGIFWGYVGMIEGLLARIKEEVGRPMTVVATGGLAALFAETTQMFDHVEEDLTLRGLLEIHQRNAGTTTGRVH